MSFEVKTIWLNGKFIRWEDAKVHILTHALHYGTAIFEGARCYDTKRGPALFRLKEHIDRFFLGMKALYMPVNFSKNEIKNAILETVRRNKLKDCYVRPFAFYGYGNVGVNPKGRGVEVAIIAVPFKDYLPPKPITVKIPPFLRINSAATVRGRKISGMYYNAALSGIWANKHNADEALMLDAAGNIAEGASSNVFCVKKTKTGITLVTPESEDILEGITRDTILKMAKDLGLKTKIKRVTPREFLKMDEAFFTGTAIEIHPIGKLNNKKIGDGAVGEITSLLRNYYQKIVHGEIPKYRRWLAFV